MIQIDKEEITEWGKVQYYNSSEDTFRFAIYEYNDEPEVIYLSNVFVSPESRHVGFGNTILKLVDKIAKNKGAQVIFLKVKKVSFAYNWYNRHGYEEFDVDKEDNTMIWMKKSLNMTKEEKQLLLKDLCGRLPYGIVVDYKENEFETPHWKITTIYPDTFDGWIGYDKRVGAGSESGSRPFKIGEVKPYLRPMSSMTEEEKEELCRLCDLEKSYDDRDYFTHYGIEVISEYCIDSKKIPESIINYSVIDFFYEHHLDWRGLIPMGLAIEASEDMYKEE